MNLNHIKELFKVTVVAATVSSLLGCGTTSVINKETKTESYKLTTLYDYRVLDSETKAEIQLSQLVQELEQVDVIFVGEFHSHQASHLLQTQLLTQLAATHSPLILSMEQFTRDNQSVLDKYLANEYGEQTLLKEGKAWEHYKGSYRASVEFARENNIPVIAANSPAMHVRCVGKQGLEILDKLPTEQRQWSAENIDINNQAYQDKFYQFLNSAGSMHGQSPEQMKSRMLKIFSAQLLRDATMAESIAKAIEQNSGAKVVHFNGSFHSDSHLGTVEELKKRLPNIKIKVLSPQEHQDGAEVDYTKGDFVYLLKPLPTRYIDKDKQNASIRELMAKRMKETCDI